MSNTMPLFATDIPTSPTITTYPEPFSLLMNARSKKRLGDFFSLKNFGINLTTLAPGGISALLHKHAKQDEFIYILQGTPTLYLENTEYLLHPGMCMGFPAKEQAHQLINKSKDIVIYLEVGDRLPYDSVEYPNDDIQANMDNNGKWVFTRKDGSAFS